MKRINKYNNKKVEFQGIKFDSKKEMERYILLKEKEKTGELYDLELQKSFEVVPKTDLFRAVTYRADFTYRVPGYDGIFAEDVKGYRGGEAYRIFKIKQKLMYYKLGIEVFEI